MNSGVPDPLLNPFDTVRRLREQRNDSVGSTEQYLFIYKFLGDWIKKYIGLLGNQH